MKRKFLTGVLAMTVVTSLFTAPVSATSTKELKTKNGEVEEGYIGKNGKIVYKGTPENKDSGLWYVSSNKNKQLDQDEDLGDITAFVDREYLETDNDYKVVMSSGKVEDLDLDLENIFYKKTKNSDVYDFDSKSDVSFDTKERIEGTSSWFYKISNRFGVIDESGSYIDISKYANLQIKPSGKDKTVTIKEYDKEYDSDVKAELKDCKPIAHDKSYFYFLCDVTVTSGGSTSDIKTIMKTSRSAKKTDETNYVSAVNSYVIDDEELTGATAFSARSGKLYAIAKEDGNNEIKIMTTKTSREKEDGKYVTKMVVDDTTKKDCETWTTDVYGNIWFIDSGKIYGFDGKDVKQYFKCDSSANKLEVYDASNVLAWEDGGEEYYYITGTSTNSGDDKDSDDKDSDNKDSNNKDADNKDDKNKDLTGDKNSEGISKTGWNKQANGTYLYSEDGKTAVKSKWVKDGSLWYYLGEDGVMRTGWFIDPKTWQYHHLDEMSGAMTTGWYNDHRNGEWYYFDENGYMKTGWVQWNGNWYCLSSRGAMIQGWLLDRDGNYYFLGDDGKMRHDCYIGEYKLGSSGAWIR